MKQSRVCGWCGKISSDNTAIPHSTHDAGYECADCRQKNYELNERIKQAIEHMFARKRICCVESERSE